MLGDNCTLLAHVWTVASVVLAHHGWDWAPIATTLWPKGKERANHLASHHEHGLLAQCFDIRSHSKGSEAIVHIRQIHLHIRFELLVTFWALFAEFIDKLLLVKKIILLMNSCFKVNSLTYTAKLSWMMLFSRIYMMKMYLQSIFHETFCCRISCLNLKFIVFTCPIHVVFFTLISNLATDYI